jgi:peptide/nickel transport system substrate-binding protein
MGVNSPAVEAMIAAMLKAPDSDAFTAATKSLDRVLTSGRYVIPIWYSDVSRLAYSADLKYPEDLPLYGDWSGFLPDIWWHEAQ